MCFQTKDVETIFWKLGTVLVVLITVLFGICIFLAVRYYYHLMIPLKVFTEGISNMEGTASP